MSKSQNNPLNCACYATCCIINHTKKHVNQEIGSLLAGCDAAIAVEVPTGKGDEGFEDGGVPEEVEVGLGEVADAVDTVHHHDEKADGENEDGVEDEFVEVADCEQIDDEELEGDVEDLNIGIDVHFLVGDDGGIIGHLGDAEHGAEDAALIDPMGSCHAPLRDNELVRQEPQADGLGEDEDHHGDTNVDYQSAGKSICQAFFITAPQFERQETTCCTAH